MKTTAILLLLTFATGLRAQDKSKERDPFIKDKQAQAGPGGAAETAPKAPPAPVAPPRNVLCLVETITLPQAGYSVLLEGAAGGKNLYETVQDSVKQGGAKLDGCHFLANKSGQRAVLECVDELMYPIEFDYADSAGLQYMTSLETERLGDRLEMDWVLEPGGDRVSVTHAVMRERFDGFRPCKAESTLPGVPVPVFTGRESPATSNALVGVPTLLATLPHANSGDITLVFATFKVAEVGKPAKAAAKRNGNVVVTIRVISLDRSAGCALLKKHWQNDVASLAELKTMMAAQQATLEHVSTVVVTSGNRVSQHGGEMYRYGTEFSPPQEATAGSDKVAAQAARPASLKSQEMRILGFNWESEYVVNAEGSLIDTMVAFSNVRMAPVLKDKHWPERYPELPVFTTQNITTAFTQEAGSTLLMGTLNPPGDTGVNERQDEGRMWLVFQDAALE
ncbi:MAG: hypothetical protein ACO1TE_27675 [Prosthecobacter sp.]